ncbi:MAG: hypothetical protein IPJ00_09465 [Saprospirales bacterium]|nr:hypothetical protein [Saprospirales bacterium]
MKASLLLPILLFLTASCNAPQTVQAPPIPEAGQVFYLDSLEAAGRVSRDDVEGFFEKIGALDRAIQMQRSEAPTLEAYREFLRRDVLSFTAEEQGRLEKEISEIYRLCEQLSPHLLPDTLRLIKTRGAYYGASAWYTREDYIVIPENALRAGPMQDVLLHELFHVLSRNHPRLRKDLYELIGFIRLSEPIQFPEPLRSRLLLNPDGMDHQWATPLLSPEGKEVMTIPLIFSQYEAYNPKRPLFFAHLDFQLFALEMDSASKAWAVQVNSEGKSTLGPEFRVDYLRKVRDNTTYLIHPDEILADNFIWAVQGPERWKDFSSEGQSLLEAIVGYLKNWQGD